MNLLHKTIPAPILGKLIPPERERIYFENCAAVPFDAQRKSFSLRNAWWLAEASLLAYQAPAEPLDVTPLKNAGYGVEFLATPLTQAVFIHGNTHIIVAFCGTRFEGFGGPRGLFRVEAIDWRDLMTDLEIAQVEFRLAGRVHAGARQAFDESWPAIKTRLDRLQSDRARPLWLAGHSLGAALATLAACECAPHGLCTFGSPKVGDPTFARNFQVPNVYRFIHFRDLVPLLPPGNIYVHVGAPKYLDAAGNIADTPGSQSWRESFQASFAFEATIAKTFLRGFNPLDADKWPVISEAMADHAPVYYANHLWNHAISEPIP